MQLSVIVPVYNGAKFLEENIRSLQEQTYENFEAVYIDDGSTDESLEIIKAICSIDKRFRYIKKDNGGIASAIQTGIENVNNDYIVWMDQDDLAVPNRLTWTAEAFLTGAELIMGKYEIVDESLRSTGRIISLPDFVTSENFLLEELKRNYVLGSALAFKKYDGLNVFPRSGGTTDIDITLKFLLSERRFTYTPHVLIKYRIHQSNVSANYLTTKNDFKNVMSQYSYEYLKDILMKHGYSNSNVYLALGMLSLFFEEFNRAETFLEKAKQTVDLQSKEYVDVMFYLAVLKFSNKQIEDSFYLLQELSNVSNNLAIYNNLGICFVAFGDFDEALKYFLYCKDANEDFQDATNNIKFCMEKCELIQNYSFTKRLMRDIVIHTNIKQ